MADKPQMTGVDVENLAKASNITKDMLETYRESANAAEKMKDSVQDMTEALQKMLKLTDVQSKIFGESANKFGDLSTKAGNLYTTTQNLINPATFYFELLSRSVDRFIELDNAALKFRETTGFLSSQTKDVENNIRVASRDLSQFGVTAEVAGESAEKLANAFGDVSIANKDNIEYVALMKQNLGIAAEDSVNVLQSFMGIGAMSPQIARETAGAAASLAKAAGVPFGMIMKDVSKPSSEVRALLRGSVDALIKGAIEAKRLGTSLELVGKAAAGMLDFQTSISDEMEASVLFGKDINLQRARELSYAGDLKGFAKEQSRLLKEAGDVSKMDYFQRISIAKALGMSVEEMDKMNAKQQELNKLRIDDPETYARYTANLDTMDKTNESLSEKYQKEMKSQQLASQQQKLLASINSIMVELGEVVLPLLSAFISIASVLLKISVITTKFVLIPFKVLYDLVDELWVKFGPGIDVLQTTGFYLQKILDLMDKYKEGVAVVSAGLIFYFMKFQGLGFGNILMRAILYPLMPLKFILQKTIGSAFKGAMDVAGKTVAASGEKIASNLASSAVGAAPTGAGAGPSGFLNSMKGINPATVLALGAALIMFAGAVLILAHAAKVFGSPEAQAGFASMAIAAIGLAVITATLIGLSGGITTASPIILPAIGIMLAFAAAVGILSLAAMGFGKSFQMFIDGFERAIKINLFSLAAGFYTLSGAIATFGASMAVGGIGSLFGGGITSRLMELAAISPALNSASMALSSIGSTLQMFKDAAVVDGIENITEAIKGLNKEINNVNLLNVAGLSLLGNNAKGAAGTAGGGGGDEVVAKLDELISLMKNGGLAVNLNGRAAGNIIASDIRFFGASGIS